MDLGMNLTPNEEALQENLGSSRLITNGMYDFIIDTMYVNKSKETDNKGLSFNMIIKSVDDVNNPNPVTQTIYSAIIYKKKDGTVSDLGKGMMTKLSVILGKTTEQLNKTVSKQIKTKDGVETVEAISALTGAKLTGKFRQEFGLYNDKLTDKVRLMSVYRFSDKATAAEIFNAGQGKEVELGKQYKMEAEKGIEPKYNDKLTPEKVAELKQNSSAKSTTSTTTVDSNFLSDLDDDNDEFNIE